MKISHQARELGSVAGVYQRHVRVRAFEEKKGSHNFQKRVSAAINILQEEAKQSAAAAKPWLIKSAKVRVDKKRSTVFSAQPPRAAPMQIFKYKTKAA